MTHLQREIDRLKRNILTLSALVEENLRRRSAPSSCATP